VSNDGTNEHHLSQTIAELRERLARLEAGQAQDGIAQVVPLADEQPSFGRRALLRRVGTVMAGATAATVVGSTTRPAAAAVGDAIAVGETTFGAPSGTTPLTTLKVTNLNAGASAIFAVTDGTNPSASRRAAFVGAAGSGLGTGVAGYSTGSGSVGVLGQAETAFGAASNTTHLKLTDTSGGTSSLPTAASIASRTALPGEVIFDRSSNLWLGTSDGYRKLGGTSSAGAFHIITPVRVYDSRAVSVIGSLTNRLVQVTNGTTVPTGARGILCTLTVTSTAGPSGFLTLTSGSVTSTDASSINWFAAGQNLATTVVTALDTSGRIKVFNNSGASTHFIVDVTGYFL
jgi:hypothetical protein